MDAPHPDPSRGRQATTGVFARIVRLFGLALFLTGIAMGCYAGLRWLQTGHGDPTLIEDVVVANLPGPAQAWIFRPRSWVGLHRMVVWGLRIPLYASVAFGGFLILLASTAPRRN